MCITRATMAQMLAEVARGEIGNREVGGSNAGPQINKYFAAAGIDPGDPWCACFVAWCVTRVGDLLGGRLSWCYGAYCPDLAAWGRQHGCAAKGRAAPGMVMLQYHAEMGRYAHTGIVEKVDGSRVTCIEGNTNNDGSRAGYGVLRQTRDLSDRYLYVDLMAANQPPQPGRVVAAGREWPAWMRKDRLYTPARDLGEKLGASIGFAASRVTVNGKPLDTVQILSSGHAPARDLAVAAGKRCAWDPATRTLTVT